MKTNLYICAALVLFGMAGHFVKKLYDLEQAGTILSPLTYARQRPYTVLAAVFGGYGFALVAFFMGQLNELSAIFAGILCSQGLDTMRARAAGRLRLTDEGEESGV